LEEGVENQLTTNYVTNIPPMATDHNAVFYGVELGHDNGSGTRLDDGSMTPRFFGAVANSTDDLLFPHQDYTDSLGILSFAERLDFYVTQWFNFANQASENSVIKFGIFEVGYGEVRDAYKRGVDWFPTLDPSWKWIVGSVKADVTQQCVCSEEGGNTIPYWIGECNDSNIPCDNPSVEYVLGYDTKLSDAFILAESAMNGPGRTYTPRLMDGSNHLQMKNDSNTKDAIKAIFEDGLDQGNPNAYFKTDPR